MVAKMSLGRVSPFTDALVSLLEVLELVLMEILAPASQVFLVIILVSLV